ncbi:MAG: penicillin-binding protein 2 [Rhodospirillaceae bacterium]
MIFQRIRHPFSPSAAPVEEGETPVVIPDRVNLDGVRKHALETGRNRLLVTGVLFTMAFVVIGGRLIDLAMFSPAGLPKPPRLANNQKTLEVRADIVDRNGILLATSLPTAALYANPQHVLDADEAATKLARVLPGYDQENVRARLASDKTFVWLHRNLTPKLQFAVNALGVPGLYFQRAERRVYPHGPLVSHVLGMTNIDGEGLSGVERYFDGYLKNAKKPLRLSVDIRIQSLVREELSAAMEEFDAIGAAGVVMDVRDGSVVSMVSLPDFNPNEPVSAAGIAGFNRATKGVYEMGSTFKLFTAAMALDTGRVRLRDRFDATKPIKISRFTISDYHAKNKWMTVPEIIVHSSNIGAAKMALDVGTPTQKKYLKRLGLLSPAAIELPEVGSPLTPDRWREINTMTISYGHGIAVSPLQLSAGISSLVNGGILFKPTVIQPESDVRTTGIRVIRQKTSKTMRGLMRLVVQHGTGRKAEVPGYLIGGKTGTADKPGVSRRGYGGRKVISSFVAAFPVSDPRYVVLALVDEPKGNKKTFGYATGGWVAAPVIQKVVRRMVPLVGLEPSVADEVMPKPGDTFYIPGKKVSKRAVKKKASIAENETDKRVRDNPRPRGSSVAVN